MVKIAIAGATSQLGREIIDKLVATQKHEIIALVRKDPSDLPTLPGLTWVQTTYEDKDELVELLQGVHTVLCFITVHQDLGNETQKRLIDASVEAGVKRYAPSEWSTGVKLTSSTDVMPWYANKVDVVKYLEQLNKDKQVLEYCRFQVGPYMNNFTHPHRTTKHVSTISSQFDYEKLQAIAVEGSLDTEFTYTTVEDIANIVARAVDYEGTWPVIGGVSGDRLTVRELLRLAELVRGKPFKVDWLKMEDLEAGELKSDNYPRVDLPSIPKDQVEAFSKMATRGVLIASCRGAWTVSDEWNWLLPDYKFTKVEEFLRGIWQ